MIDQKHRSLQWRMEERGMSADWWGGHDIETESGLIWFHASVDKWCQSRRVAFAAKNPDKYQGQTNNLPLWRSWETQSITALCFTHSNHHRHKFGFFLSKFHPEPHLRKHRLWLSKPPFHQKHQKVIKKKKEKSSDRLQSRVTRVIFFLKKGKYSLHFKQKRRCFWSPKRERKPRALNLYKFHILILPPQNNTNHFKLQQDIPEHHDLLYLSHIQNPTAN